MSDNPDSDGDPLESDQLNQHQDCEPREKNRLWGYIMNNTLFEMRDARQLFDELDTNKNGSLDLKEIKENLEKRNIPSKDCERIARDLIKKADTNGDEKLEIDEFLSIYKDLRYHLLMHTYIDSFKPDSSQPETKTSWTWGIILISTIQIVLFLIGMNVQANSLNEGLKLDPYNKQAEIYRYITYMLIHDQNDHLHITMNVIFQLIVGVPLEMAHSWWRVLLIYFAGVLAGSLSFAIKFPCKTLVGCSAGLYGLFAAHFCNCILNWKKKMTKLHVLMISIYFAIDIFTYLINESLNTSYLAHWCGAGAGFLVGFFALKTTITNINYLQIFWASAFIYQLAVFIAILYIYLRFTLTPQYFNTPDCKPTILTK